MRKTLHYISLDLAAAAHGATVRYRLRDSHTMASRLMTMEELGRAQELLLDRLWDSWVEADALEHHFLSHSQFSVQAWRAALKCLWEAGAIVCHNSANSWCQERRQYRATEAYFGSDILNVHSERDAEGILVAAYLESYAPSTLRDIMWWSGLSAQRIKSVLDHVPDLLERRVPWAQSPIYLRQGQLDRLVCAPPERGWIRLVGHEEVTFKAYFETRSRFVSEEHYSSLFNSIGEARPAIVVDGVACGTWQWARGSVQHNLFTPLAFDKKAMLHETIDGLAAALEARVGDQPASDQLSLWGTET